MNPGFSICGMLVAITFSPSGALAKEPAEDPKKKPVATKTAEKKTTPPIKRVPQAAAPPMSKAKNGSLPAYVEPDPKTLGLGCASGED